MITQIGGLRFSQDGAVLVPDCAERHGAALATPFFEDVGVAPLLAYRRTSEKISGSTGKIVYSCPPPDEWGEMLPIRASFRHGYPQAIVARVTDHWRE